MKYTKMTARKKGESSLKENIQMSKVKELHSKNKLVDSAYETDRSSNLSANQKVCYDPYEYELNMEEEVTVKKKITKKQARNLKKTLSAKDSRTKKSSGHKIKSTSTPVLQQCSNDSSSVTPEVTPILATRPFNDASPNNRSFITPQIPVARSVRKRECNASGFMSISKQLSYSSLVDSGIDLSPPPAKKKLTDTLDAWRIKENLAKKELCSEENNLNANAIMTKEHFIGAVSKNILHENSNLSTSNTIRQPEGAKNSEHLSLIDSCFGFDSLESPQISPLKKMNNRKMVAKSTYRLRSSTCDSSLKRHLKDDCLSSSSPQESQKNIPSSPLSLFTEELAPSEAECIMVNKSSIKSYKSSGRKLKSQSVSKMDEWASNFNNEMEKIEQFDLYME